MSSTAADFSKKEKTTVVLAVSIGNMLEWYEIYLYIYWAPLISKLFFPSKSEVTALAYTYLLFAFGFLARPLGGVFFGRLGDRIGRKKSMILSIIMMIFPTIITGLLPTYAQIGIFAPYLLGCMRVLQSFPAGGELPGGACYLYESSRPPQRKFLTSWICCGLQIGIMLSALECYFLEKFLSHEDLITWGWRFSFLIGGLIGFLGLFLRTRLHETPLYKQLSSRHKVVREPILQVLAKHKKGLLMVLPFGALNCSSFYLISVNFPTYFVSTLGANARFHLIITAALMLLVTVPLPFFGRLADKYGCKKPLIYSTIGMIALLYPLYLAINGGSLLFSVIVVLIFSILFACISALVPYIMCDLFPTYSRFTCVGVGFNTVDALIGGFTPAIALLLFRLTGNTASFCWFLLVCGLISLWSFFYIKERIEKSESH